MLKSIRNLDLIVGIVIGYIGILSEKADDRRMVMVLIKISRHIFDTPKIVFYAIADYLFYLCAFDTTGFSYGLRKKAKYPQLSLFLFQLYHSVGIS